MVKGDRNVYDNALTGVAAAVVVAVLLLLGDRSNGDGGMRRRRGIPAAESGAGADLGGCCSCWGASAAGTIEAAVLSLQSCGRFCAVCAGAADSFGDRHEQAHECGVVAIDADAADETDDNGVAALAEVAEVAVVAVEALEPMLDNDTALSLEFVREMTAAAAPKPPMPWGDADVGVDLPDTMMALSPTGLATALRKSV
jgi:hypothetical protein